MGITYSNKELSTDSISCGGSFKIKLSLTAEPDIADNPTDIVLILDRSRSMTGNPLKNLKIGAKTFIDIIDEATDSAKDGHIGGGSHIGIVSFSSSATQDTQLITSVADLKTAVDSLTADGFTNHREAFEKALALFDPQSTNAKVMVMFTDGNTTIGGDPEPIAAAAKAQGVTIYVIGLVGSDGIDIQALNSWASSPPSSYVAITPDEEELEKLFEDLAQNISKPGATDIVLRDMVSPCFKITSVHLPTKGTAALVDQSTVEWKIDSLGVNGSEGAELEFDVLHLGQCSGDIEVNDDLYYSDAEGNSADFPSPVINVDCGTVITPEECPEPVDIEIDGCDDFIEFHAGDIDLSSQGRILLLDATLRGVCPNRRVALAAIVTEVDAQGVEHKRGVKTMTIPAHTRTSCRDILVRCIKFVLPEDENTPPAVSVCGKRKFKARFIAHYIDSDYECCPIL